MQSQRPHHAGVVLFSVHDARRVSSLPAAGRRCHRAFGRGGRLPAAKEWLSLSLGVKANNLSRFHTLWVNGSFPLHPMQPYSLADTQLQVQRELERPELEFRRD